MKLLIVDDQTSVVNGLVKGINWKEMNIDQVYVSFNSFEAKQILQKESIDIMLCDIEMPVENGIQLLRWINLQKIDIECIFLTAHAEFDYVKEALKEGSLDYILQPAPYEEIKEAVLRAIKNVRIKKEKKQAYSFGILQSEDEIREKTFQDMLLGRTTQKQYEKLWKVIDLPSWNQPIYLILMQIVRWKIQINHWDVHLLQFTLNNIVSELFEPYEQKVILTLSNDNICSILLYGNTGYHMDLLGVLRQLGILKNTFKEYFGGDMALYVGKEIAMFDISSNKKNLEKAMRNNVSMKEDIFIIDDTNLKENDIIRVYELPQIKRWKDYLRQNLTETVRTEIFEFLEGLAESGRLTKETLVRFHIDIGKIFATVIEELGIDFHNIFHTEEQIELYKNASNSLDDMKAVIEYITKYIQEYCFNEKEDDSNMIDKVQQYIMSNIEKDIKRSEIADYVHLNMDYLTRIFKRDVGISLKEYIIEEKMKVAQKLLQTTMLPISFVASKIGYCNYSHFSKTYKKVLGISPTDERK